jgi:hypothetical protein
LTRKDKYGSVRLHNAHGENGARRAALDLSASQIRRGVNKWSFRGKSTGSSIHVFNDADALASDMNAEIGSWYTQVGVLL